jgi:hypothetical protein
MRETTPTVRLGGTALMFVLALGLFVLASVTHVAWPLFVAWAPLIAVPWLLTRREAGQSEPEAPDGADAEASREADRAPLAGDIEDAPASDPAGTGEPESGEAGSD